MKLRFLILVCALFSVLYIFASEQQRIELSDTLTELTVVNSRINTQQRQISVPQSSFRLQQLEQEQRNALKDLSALVPNLYMPDYGSRMTSSIYIRGLGARIDNPVMGVYIDGIAVANKNSFDFDMFDIRSINISRGPQGALFGRNTIGGIMEVNTLSPLDYEGTRLSVGYGRYNTASIKISHYQRFNSKWGMALGGYYNYTDGRFTNSFDLRKVDWQHNAGARLRIDGLLPHEGKISAILSYNFVNQGGFPYHLKNQPVNHNDFCGYTRHNALAGVNYIFPLGLLELGGSTSYQLLADRMQMDQDYLPLSYFTLVQAQQEHTVSQELTLRPNKAEWGTKPIRSHWDWIAGLSLSYTHNNMSAPVTFLQDGIDSLILSNANGAASTRLQFRDPQFVINSLFLTNKLNAALYLTAFYNLHNWHFEIGARLDYEYQLFNYNSFSTVFYRWQNINSDKENVYKQLDSKLKGAPSLSYLEVLPRAAVAYKSHNWQVSVAMSEGHKAGGFNSQLFSDILKSQLQGDLLGVYDSEYEVDKVITYKPERCLNVELGAKGWYDYNDWHLQTGLTAYELEVFNQQLTVFPAIGTGRYMTNAGHSRSLGLELTANIAWKNLSIDLAYGYTYAYFTEYISGNSDYKNKRVPYVPENTLSAGLTYRIDLKHNFFQLLDLNLNTSAFGRIYWDEQNTEYQPFYALLNANISLKMRYITFALWGKNLTNTQYDVFHFVSMGNSFMQSGRPITFGCRLNIAF